MIISEEDFYDYLGSCDDCGCDVAGYLCNSGLIGKRPEASYEDYWASCTNTCCKNYYGEGYLQFKPDFLKED